METQESTQLYRNSWKMLSQSWKL